MSELNNILSKSTDILRKQIVAAFEVGKIEGRKEGREEGRKEVSEELNTLKAKLAALIGAGGPETTVNDGKETPDDDDTSDRAERGSVGPAILSFEQRNPQGTTAIEITEATGIKYNTVRGTLRKHRLDHKVHKRGEKWFPGPGLLLAETE